MKGKGFDYLSGITAVDYGDRIEVLYLLYDTSTKRRETLKVSLPTGMPALPPQGIPALQKAPPASPAPPAKKQAGVQRLEVSTVMHVYPAADWHERELSEMFGVEIAGRKAERLLLEKWNGSDAPLRKSFVWGKPYNKL